MQVLWDRMYSYPWDDERGSKLAAAYLILEKENGRMWDEAFGMRPPKQELHVVPYDRRLRDFLVAYE